MTFLEMTFSGAVLILAAAAVRVLTLRRLPKGTFVVLWWTAALRLLMPVKLPSSLSVYTLIEALRSAAADSAVPPGPAMLPPETFHVQMIPSRPAAAPQPAAGPFPIWTALWATGSALLALWFLVRYVRWRRRFRESIPADCPGLETWLHIRRKVHVRITDQIAAPLTYGLLRPVILLPKTLDIRDEGAMTCVLAHELAHIRRLDGLYKLVLAAALCIHWFNPAVWLLYILANRDMELRCDEAAVLALGEDSRERYALTLIRLAELRNNTVPLCGFSHKSGMEERIEAIMCIKKKSMLACAAALTLVLGITTAFATSAKPLEADDVEAVENVYIDNLLDTEEADMARLSTEMEAQWHEVLAPYVPLGLSWSFDDPDHDGNGLTMMFENHEVRGIYDEHTGEWITEHAGNGAYAVGAVELCAVYENGELTGLRLATEEEQKQFTQRRRLSSDAQKAETLVESVHYDSGRVYFTIPESEEPWSIFIQGRILTKDGTGMSARYLEEESERAEWVPRMTYSFEVADASYDELTMDVRYGDATYFYNLIPMLPAGQPLAQEPLPEGKAEIPEGAEMIWPVDSDQITSGFGGRSLLGGKSAADHNGVDIGGMEEGAPIYAAAAGTVKETGFSAQQGNYVCLDHGSGLETFYAHCRSVEVKTGDVVALGQTIAAVGSTGNSTGPHLHFEISQNGAAADPEALLKSN